MTRNPLRRRWVVVIVGELSNTRQSLHFLRFWRRSAADRWVRASNERRLSKRLFPDLADEITRYEVERLP